MLKMINGIIKKRDIGNPPWNYYFLLNLDEKEYPIYLAKLFKLNTGETLPLIYDFKTRSKVINKKKLKTFNQKIQWLKLYDNTELKKQCTDKVQVRSYVKEKIGEEYLKPVLQIIQDDGENKENFFDRIDFNNMPESIAIKCNHGCKWHFFIRKKSELLNNKKDYETIKQQMTGWLEQEFWCWGGFELNYKGIKSKIIIEELLESEEETAQELEIYCCNGIPQIIEKVHNDVPDKISMYDKDFNNIDFKFKEGVFLFEEKPDELTILATELSKKLSKEFLFVRVDWMIYKNKLYFGELTFSPFSGLYAFNKKYNIKLGSLIKI